MLFLNKLLPIFVLPLGVVFLLLLVALWRRKRWPVIVAAVVLYLSSIDVVAGNLIGWLESRYPSVLIAEAGKADAIVVLSGIFGPPVKPGFLVNLGEGVERLTPLACLRLRRAGNRRKRIRHASAALDSAYRRSGHFPCRRMIPQSLL